MIISTVKPPSAKVNGVLKGTNTNLTGTNLITGITTNVLSLLYGRVHVCCSHCHMDIMHIMYRSRSLVMV